VQVLAVRGQKAVEINFVLSTDLEENMSMVVAHCYKNKYLRKTMHLDQNIVIIENRQ
jgi:hypothetical protein